MYMCMCLFLQSYKWIGSNLLKSQNIGCHDAYIYQFLSDDVIRYLYSYVSADASLHEPEGPK